MASKSKITSEEAFIEDIAKNVSEKDTTSTILCTSLHSEIDLLFQEVKPFNKKSQCLGEKTNILQTMNQTQTSELFDIISNTIQHEWEEKVLPTLFKTIKNCDNQISKCEGIIHTTKTIYKQFRKSPKTRSRLFNHTKQNIQREQNHINRLVRQCNLVTSRKKLLQTRKDAEDHAKNIIEKRNDLHALEGILSYKPFEATFDNVEIGINHLDGSQTLVEWNVLDEKDSDRIISDDKKWFSMPKIKWNEFREISSPGSPSIISPILSPKFKLSSNFAVQFQSALLQWFNPFLLRTADLGREIPRNNFHHFLASTTEILQRINMASLDVSEVGKEYDAEVEVSPSVIEFVVKLTSSLRLTFCYDQCNPRSVIYGLPSEVKVWVNEKESFEESLKRCDDALKRVLQDQSQCNAFIIKRSCDTVLDCFR